MPKLLHVSANLEEVYALLFGARPGDFFFLRLDAALVLEVCVMLVPHNELSIDSFDFPAKLMLLGQFEE